MSREIKFRGRTNNGQWVYGFYVAREGDHKTKHYIYTGKTASNQSDWCEKWEVDPKTVWQYTGLKDKNGKEIYENDILLIPEGFYGENAMTPRKEHMEVVEHDVCHSDCDGSGYWINLPDSVKWSDCEIIGNIHENPELLT